MSVKEAAGTGHVPAMRAAAGGTGLLPLGAGLGRGTGGGGSAAATTGATAGATGATGGGGHGRAGDRDGPVLLRRTGAGGARPVA